MKKPKRPNEFYPTDQRVTKQLLKVLPSISGTILEPCAGALDMSNLLKAAGNKVITNDIDPSRQTDYHCDATKEEFWEATKNLELDWVVTNPPDTLAHKIIPHAFKAAAKGIAMYVRLSYLEPCSNRAQWLSENPPDRIICLPRFSFTGDKKTDTMTRVWLVWDKTAKPTHHIQIVARSEMEQ
jgi:hypothetical protein